MPNATYLTVEEAARKYGVKKKVLTQLIADGMVQTRETSVGDVLVAEQAPVEAKEGGVPIWAILVLLLLAVLVLLLLYYFIRRRSTG